MKNISLGFESTNSSFYYPNNFKYRKYFFLFISEKEMNPSFQSMLKLEARSEEITEWHLKIVYIGQFNQCFETNLLTPFQLMNSTFSWILISWNQSNLQWKFLFSLI